MSTARSINIQQAGVAAGLTPDTIRFYEKKGVLPRPPRQANRYRAYTEEHVATLRLARGLRQLVVPLEQVRPILAVARTGVCGEMRGQLVETLTSVVSDIDAQIAELKRTRQHASALLDGLNAMRSEDAPVPGARACPCIGMVTERENPPASR
jgi:DNA-binding transcriptional MerR regulator